MRDINQKSLLFDKIFETSTDAIIVFDGDLRIIKTSQSIHKILGYTEEEMLGNNVKSLIYVKDTAILEKEAKKANEPRTSSLSFFPHRLSFLQKGIQAFFSVLRKP
jgi:PAS domain S-box-containing protein